MSLPTPRSEEEIFIDLVANCGSPGFVHAIASMCLRDNIIRYSGDLTGDDFARMRGRERLIRNEINALLGCMVKSPIVWSQPAIEELQRQIDKSDALLSEYHERMNFDFSSRVNLDSLKAGLDPMATGEAIREAVFYAAESAYVFQFRDMAAARYANDADWLLKNKGYSPKDAEDICRAIFSCQHVAIKDTLRSLREIDMSEWSLLGAFRLDVDNIATQSNKMTSQVIAFLESFTLSAESRNLGYNKADDFNEVGASPILKDLDGAYYLFQYYSLVESVYDSPFYWFSQDDSYFKVAAKNRGDFTEDFLFERLCSIFGLDAVFRNIDIFDGKNKVGEIDCLVVFGEYALIFQAKSQRLTIPARQGKIERLRLDFDRAVQKAYDQAISCAKAITSKKAGLRCSDGRTPNTSQVEIIYPICVLADHYPALAMQSRAFLKPGSENLIRAPLVCDLFLIDVIAEMLPSPLRFLSYISLRAEFGEKILVTNELSAFGHYLRNSMWVDEGYNMMLLDDSVSCDLDAAMTVRREGLPGRDTPSGVLTKLINTRLGKFISEIEHDPDQFSVGFGLSILQWSEDSVRSLSFHIDRLIRQSGLTGKHHDISVPIDDGKSGITIHVNFDPSEIAVPRLKKHMIYRKYVSRANKWFGLLIEPTTGKLLWGAKVSEPHAFDYYLEEVASQAIPPRSLEDLRKLGAKARKTGRNQPCPCGSGKKYKNCCLISYGV